MSTNPQNRGIFLVNTLIILSVIALLLVSQMQLISVHLKTLHHIVLREQELRKLEQVANHLIEFREWTSDCVVEGNAKGFITAGEGCVTNYQGEIFLFLVENLGEYACLKIRHKDKAWSSHHWRITITAKAKSKLLQIRWAEKMSALICRDTPEYIPEGIINWRYDW